MPTSPTRFHAHILVRHKVAMWKEWGDGLDMWDPRPDGWSDAVRRAQLDKGLVPDGMWGPVSEVCGIPKPEETG